MIARLSDVPTGGRKNLDRIVAGIFVSDSRFSPKRPSPFKDG
jgi:hypothetical protein